MEYGGDLDRYFQIVFQERKEIGSQCSSSEESEENSEEASDVSDSELEADSFFFLQVRTRDGSSM